MSEPSGATRSGWLRTLLARRLERLRAWLARRDFEVRVWNDINPKDPQLVRLYVGEPGSLRESILGFCGSEYLALEHGGEGLELYSSWGLRVSDLRPSALWALGVRRVTLYHGRRGREALGLVLRMALLCLAFTALVQQLFGVSLAEPVAARTQPVVVQDPFVETLGELRDSCPPEQPCELEDLRWRNVVDDAFLEQLAERPGLVLSGFRPGRAELPQEFRTLLRYLLQEPRLSASCPELLLVGRASPSGQREANLRLAARRAASVRQELLAASPGPRQFTTLLVEGDATLPLDLERLRHDLEAAGIASPAEAAAFQDFALRSVELRCLPVAATAAGSSGSRPQTDGPGSS